MYISNLPLEYIAIIPPCPSLKVVVRDLAASGTIRAQLRPLMNKIPVVGAVKISFLGAPTFTYKVSSYGINPMFIPGLETFINSFITGQVLQPFTYPDGFVVKLDPSAGDVASELPEGLLTVTLKEATGVPRMDFIGGADPYVKYESLGGGELCRDDVQKVDEHLVGELSASTSPLLSHA